MLGNPLFISALKSPISPPLTSRQHTQHEWFVGIDQLAGLVLSHSLLLQIALDHVLVWLGCKKYRQCALA